MKEKTTGTILARLYPVDSHGSTTDIPETPIRTVHIDTIDFNDRELCFRVDYTVKDLADDIERNGQQFPVILRLQDGGSQYQIVSGFRRCTALKALGKKYVKAIVREDLDDDKAYQVSFIENEKRKNLKGIDKAYAIVKLSKRGKSPREIQNLFSIGERQYYRYKKVMEFPTELKDAITDRFIKITHGLVLMEAQKRYKNAIDFDEWIDWIIENKASIRQLKEHVRLKCSKKQKDFGAYLNPTKRGGFRLSQMVFDPRKTDRSSADKMMTNLREALLFLEQWAQEKKR